MKKLLFPFLIEFLVSPVIGLSRTPPSNTQFFSMIGKSEDDAIESQGQHTNVVLAREGDNPHFDPAYLSALGALYAAAFLEAQSWETAVRVAPYRGDREGAISYTFDDGLRNHHLVAAPMLNELGLRATFFIVAGSVTNTKEEAELKKPGAKGALSWDEVREMAAQGHEIRNHTWTHAGLTKLDDAMAEEEISKAYEKIQKETGIFPFSFCYPGNGRNARLEAIVMRQHFTARVYQKGMGERNTTPDELNAWADRQANERKWGVAMLHGLIDGYDPIDPAVFRAHLSYVKERQNVLWVDTFGAISRYRREYDSAKLQVISKTAESVTFVLDSPLPRPPFDTPLTTVIAAPGAIHAEARTRDGRTLPTTVFQNFLHVECVPGPEPVTVTWKTL